MHSIRRNNKIYVSDSGNSVVGKISTTSPSLPPALENRSLLKTILVSSETKEEGKITQLSRVTNSNNMGSLFSATDSHPPDGVSSPLLCQSNPHHVINYSSIQLYQSDEIQIRKIFESGQEVATRVGYWKFLHTVYSYCTSDTI